MILFKIPMFIFDKRKEPNIDVNNYTCINLSDNKRENERIFNESESESGYK